MGIEFTGLDEKTKERLQQQIETMAAESETSKNPKAPASAFLSLSPFTQTAGKI